MDIHVRERESRVPSRRQALCVGAALVTVPAGILALVTPTPGQAAPVPDPIFARIAEHKRQMAPVQACDTTRDGEDRLAELCDLADDAFVRVLETVPTTLPGLLALVRYVREATPDLALGMQETEEGESFEGLFLASLETSLDRMIAEARA
ncbi:hypothetical protein [Ancylobacter sp. FA202]|uniref:hypothetical protein n=1 Tax=Ancylobacter sp. FA202 TaxID=1111106 RepID=UPI000375F9B4|nr:hypothetical protein [Ancylobacter sp. FA202]